MKEALTIRKRMKRKKPAFTRQDSHKKPSLSRSGWKRPRGWQNKVRLQKKGYKGIVKPGYRGPAAVRNTLPSGATLVVVSSLKELEAVPKGSVAQLRAGLGLRKTHLLLKRAGELKIPIHNHDLKKFEASLKKTQEARKAKKKLVEERRKKKAEKKEEKKEEKKQEAPDEEEKAKEAAKKEKDKVLTKRGAEF